MNGPGCLEDSGQWLNLVLASGGLGLLTKISKMARRGIDSEAICVT